MIWTFILGAIAGWAAPFAEERLKPFVGEYLPGGPVQPTEMRGISLAICLLGAGVLAALSGSDHVVALTLGGVVGVLAKRLFDKARGMRAPDYDS